MCFGNDMKDHILTIQKCASHLCFDTVDSVAFNKKNREIMIQSESSLQGNIAM